MRDMPSRIAATYTHQRDLMPTAYINCELLGNKFFEAMRPCVIKLPIITKVGNLK